jgi:hypothetical protein
MISRQPVTVYKFKIAYHDANKNFTGGITGFWRCPYRKLQYRPLLFQLPAATQPVWNIGFFNH